MKTKLTIATTFPFTVKSGAMFALVAGQISPTALVHATGKSSKGVDVASLSIGTDDSSVVLQTQDGAQVAYNADDFELAAIIFLGARGLKVEPTTGEQA